MKICFRYRVVFLLSFIYLASLVYIYQYCLQGLNSSSLSQELLSQNIELRRQLKAKSVLNQDDGLPTLFLVTPTYHRYTQQAELVRLSNTLKLIRKLHWIIVEDNAVKTPLVSNVLVESGLQYTHLNIQTKQSSVLVDGKQRWTKHRGVDQRNLAMKWLRDNVPSNESGVLYFADDDNTYHERLFSEMRYTKKISMWPVGIVSKLRWEGPLCENGHVTGFFTVWKPERAFPVDMAAFAINLDLLREKKNAYINEMSKLGFLESDFLKLFDIPINEIEAKANNCKKILVWHTQTVVPDMRLEVWLQKRGKGSNPAIIQFLNKITMSLFKAREWCSAWCGSADEEFDQGSICLSNIDNHSTGVDKIIVGSLNGVLRIYTVEKGGFHANNLMVEVQLDYPILQVESGLFISGSDKLQLAVLHPRILAVYAVTCVSEEENQSFSVVKMYEHRLEHVAASMTYGPFSGVKGKDYIAVLSMDGMMLFFEQDRFSVQAYLPDFLLPGPLIYTNHNDSFVFGSATKYLQSFKYRVLASSSVGSKNTKKVQCDWTRLLGEQALSIRYIDSSITVLGERSLFLLNSNGEILHMKKLEFDPSCLLSYVVSGDPSIKYNVVCTHSSTLLVYNETRLVWAAQLPYVPVTCKIGNFKDLQGVVVTMDQNGHLFCSYLGTSPSLFTVVQSNHADESVQDLQKELKNLNTVMKSLEGEGEASPSVLKKESLSLSAVVSDYLDEISKCEVECDEEEGLSCPTITVKVFIDWANFQSTENVSLCFSTLFPVTCSQQQFHIPLLTNSGHECEVFFYTTAAVTPADLQVHVSATYFTELDVPHVVQTSFELPLQLVAEGAPPSKVNDLKLTIETNKPAMNLGELFPEMVADAVIPIQGLGIRYFGGSVVTILSAKQTNRYRIQGESFDELWLVVKETIERLENLYRESSDAVPLRFAFQGPLPTKEYFHLIDQHIDERLCMKSRVEGLSRLAQQFRVIQKRLLTRFKDKTPSSMSHLDTLLDGTYKQLLSAADNVESSQFSLLKSATSLSCGTKLMNLLTKLFASLEDDDYEILQTYMTPHVPDTHEEGWEEAVFANLSHALQASMLKSVKTLTSGGATSFNIEKDPAKLKKQISLLWDQLTKGSKLKL